MENISHLEKKNGRKTKNQCKSNKIIIKQVVYTLETISDDEKPQKKKKKSFWMKI